LVVRQFAFGYYLVRPVFGRGFFGGPLGFCRGTRLAIFLFLSGGGGFRLCSCRCFCPAPFLGPFRRFGLSSGPSRFLCLPCGIGLGGSFSSLFCCCRSLVCFLTAGGSLLGAGTPAAGPP
jgi:hypothetical protein